MGGVRTSAIQSRSGTKSFPLVWTSELGGIKFENIDDAVKQHVPKFLHSTDKDFYATGFTRLVER